MKAVATKGTLGLLGISGLGVGSYYTYDALTSKEEITSTKDTKGALESPETKPATLQETIAKEGRTILKTNEDGWDIKLHAYNTSDKKIKLTKEDVQSLKEWCLSVLSKPLNSKDDTYSQAKQVCTLPTSKEKLLKEQKVLATENDWEGRATEYAKTGKDNLAIPEFKGKTEAINKKDIENWCTSALNSEITKEKSNYNLTLKWCTKTGE
ncbi:hypothetical protein A6V39_03615 [Candidatus Mycoplasma haematobovis]|uniref:Uncharacterized protein n=1 Tax=Candidatus Mycoplasma haematobovis TaxID=432608 RepID=A0A1A9QD05_9MOLU|nr:hypothetical protein [Candidatus Mycoplasma haematobovis]OAL09974.1 hypothetical protein A6V39_03615 [Candidatus Mycoplasma haematobovis]